MCTTAFPGIPSCGKYAGGGGGGGGDPGGGGGILGTPAPGLCRTPQYGAGIGGINPSKGGAAGATNRGGGGGGGFDGNAGGGGGSGLVIVKEAEVSIPKQAPGFFTLNEVYDYVKEGELSF